MSSPSPVASTKVPSQDNNCDCGVFVVHYVERFFEAHEPRVGCPVPAVVVPRIAASPLLFLIPPCAPNVACTGLSLPPLSPTLGFAALLQQLCICRQTPCARGLAFLTELCSPPSGNPKANDPCPLGLSNYARPINHLVEWFDVGVIHKKREEIHEYVPPVLHVDSGLSAPRVC